MNRALRGWLPLAIGPPLVFAIWPDKWPRWTWMWALAVTIYSGCKWLTYRRTEHSEASLSRRLGYLFLWPGLDANAFFQQPPKPPVDKPNPGEWGFAAAKLALGLCLLFVVPHWVPSSEPMLVGWAGMLGIVFTLHFGVFHLLSCAWRAAGVEARPLMDWPILATSVSDFWGRRWNRAFRDLTHRFLFRPLTVWWGPRLATAAGFLFSGLVHEAVVTVPAGGGYGGPTLFFLIQGAALLAERLTLFRRRVLPHRGAAWLWTLLVTLPPVGLLLPRAFVVGIVVPFVRFFGATS